MADSRVLEMYAGNLLEEDAGNRKNDTRRSRE